MKWTETTITLTGNQDDLDFDGADLVRCANTSALTIRGLKAGAPGQTVTIVSVGSAHVALSHEDAGDATASSRLICFATVGKTPLAAGSGTATLQYDESSERWRLVNHEQGAWITPTFSAGDFTGNGAMTWTVDAGDVAVAEYLLSGRTLAITVQIKQSTVGGTPNTQLRWAIPGGFMAGTTVAVPIIIYNGAWGVSGGAVGGGLTYVQFLADIVGVSNWTASTNNAWVYANFQFPVA